MNGSTGIRSGRSCRSRRRFSEHQQRPHGVIAHLIGRVAHRLHQVVDHGLLVRRITQDECRQGPLGRVG